MRNLVWKWVCKICGLHGVWTQWSLPRRWAAWTFRRNCLHRWSLKDTRTFKLCVKVSFSLLKIQKNDIGTKFWVCVRQLSCIEGVRVRRSQAQLCVNSAHLKCVLDVCFLFQVSTGSYTTARAVLSRWVARYAAVSYRLGVDSCAVILLVDLHDSPDISGALMAIKWASWRSGDVGCRSGSAVNNRKHLRALYWSQH